MGLTEILNERRELAKKAIPSKVFFNHFFAVDYNIQSDFNKYNLKKIPYFNSLRLINAKCKIDTVRKLLWNSWSTEYAYNLGTQVNNEDYYKFSLHWSFPQAYYSVYLAMTAFHETQGMANDQHEKSIKLFGNSVKDNHYPGAISFHSAGLYDAFKYKNLETFKKFPEDYSGLKRIDSLSDAQTQIASFLKSTRIKNAEHKREKLAEAKDKKFLNAKGEFRKKFNKEHWDLIYQTIPVTTILNLMYRLRIKANYHDVETFIHADIDFRTFHECLGGIIDYLNFVHESYTKKAIGSKAYEEILFKFPDHLIMTTALKRYNDYIK
jgi:hypothetical protein